MTKHIDEGSIIVMFITLILFIVALFTKGITHDILLEAGVFLISVKLILGIHSLSRKLLRIEEKLDKYHDH
ncbi:MAG: hypothetical protein H7A37_06020 [Chlamydiales bacterium]|nr:hypothetical protein [Chlamydiia bacterium]MCP5507838.1 hypothetical protein [Chlamydiales bacterium]